MRWAEHIVCIGNMKIAYKILVGNMKVRNILADPGQMTG
jgi:hypothetical protein